MALKNDEARFRKPELDETRLELEKYYLYVPNVTRTLQESISTRIQKASPARKGTLKQSVQVSCNHFQCQYFYLLFN